MHRIHDIKLDHWPTQLIEQTGEAIRPWCFLIWQVFYYRPNLLVGEHVLQMCKIAGRQPNHLQIKPSGAGEALTKNAAIVLEHSVSHSLVINHLRSHYGDAADMILPIAVAGLQVEESCVCIALLEKQHPRPLTSNGSGKRR
jgi:hypothetical protein